MNLPRFRYYTRWHQFANRQRYDAPADPWRLVRVSPTDVEYYTSECRLHWGMGRVEAGDWDCEGDRSRFEETTLYRGLEQRFVDGREWEETALYERAKAQFEDGGTFRGYESLAEFRDVRCEYVDDLYRRIEEEGYRPNAQADHESASDDNPSEAAYAHHLEPLVVVGPTGEIHWAEGYHRLAIASILDLDEIPVYVLCRHEEWQRVRDRFHGVSGSERPPELEPHLDHPDVQDLVS